MIIGRGFLLLSSSKIIGCETDMLNWEKIYELNEKNNKKAGTAFEQLVLKYLSSVYRKYSWENTQSSWDNNRDFISLILDNIWGEAKYKKNSSSLGKKDVDPTMISGFLDGKIELVFIITNGQIPHTIRNRINKTGKKCGFTVVCVTQTQLEYWLIAHPEQYKIFFNESLPQISQLEAVSIENIRLENQLESNFEGSYIQPEFTVGSICNLCITFSCNTDLECVIIEKEEYPFQFIESPKILLSPGIQEKNYPVKLIYASSEPVVLEFKKADNAILFYVLDIKILNNDNPHLIYSKQESIKIEICHAINTLPNTNNNHIVAIQGLCECGKTFLMKEMAKDLSFFHVVTVLQCELSNYFGLNSMKICQMIMFFNFGDHFQNSQEYDEETKEYYKYLLIKNNKNCIIENDLLIDIFEGCFDRVIANNVINRLSKEKTTIIKKSQFARKHILFMDDVHLLSEKETDVFKMIFQQLKNSYNNSILIYASENALFDKSEIVPYVLKGLLSDDIKQCLKYNLNDWQYNAFSSLIEKMPKYPKMISELINFIKNNSSESLSLANANQYIIKLHNNKLTNLKFNLSDEEKIVLELIYNFTKGIDEQLLYAVEINRESLLSLYNKGYISYYKQRYIPCVDYFRYTYKNQQERISPNAQLLNYLYKLLDKSDIDPLFDIYQAQAILVQNNPELYLQLKKTYKTKMIEYIKEGDYKVAMLYGKIFCFDILNSESQHQQVDLEALFYYGIASIHCDSQRRAIDIFTYIKNHSGQNTLTYFRASAELLNNKYSRFQIKDILPQAIVLKRDIHALLNKNQDDNSLESHQLRVAYSTCMNRMMMIYFLKDNYIGALEIYEEFCNYHSTLSQCLFSDKYNSMLQEWKMDYARGLSVYNLQKSIRLDKECFNCFSESIDFRRKILCKIDILFFEAILKKNYDDAIIALIDCKQNLAMKGIVSEEMKTSIRITYCRLMKYMCIPEFDNISLLAPFVDEIYAEVFSAQLESHLIAQGRTAYLLYNLFSVLHLIKNDVETAIEMLQCSMKLIQNCGDKYREIINHNCNHLKDITKIDWYFYNDIMHDDTYYLDLRIW